MFCFKSGKRPWDSGVGVACGEGAGALLPAHAEYWPVPPSCQKPPTLDHRFPFSQLQLFSFLSASSVSSSFKPSLCFYFSPSCNLSASLPSFSFSLFFQTLAVSLFHTFCLSPQSLCSPVSLFLPFSVSLFPPSFYSLCLSLSVCVSLVIS